MNFTEEHGLLGEEYLETGNKLKDDLIKKLAPELIYPELDRYLVYVYARIPSEFWDINSLPNSLQRKIMIDLNTYIEKASIIRKQGLGLTVIGGMSSYKTYILYTVIKKLIDSKFTAFTISLDEFLFFLRESRDSKVLKGELYDRIKEVDFFFVLDVPEQIETSTIAQDFLAMLSLRLNRGLPVIFTVNTNYPDLTSMTTNTLLGRLLSPFARVNKLITIPDSEDNNINVVEEKWRSLRA